MFPDDELNQLKERISQMSDYELRQMVEVDYADYRSEALEFAKAELASRRVSFEAPQFEADEDDSDDSEPSWADVPCGNCGGAMRSGLLFSDKELTIVFSDNNEERFVQAYACPRCGVVRLAVDLDTEVEG
jgi:hypothetical protein